MKKISRRNFLKATGLTAAALSLAACGGSSSSAPASTAGSAAASKPEVEWPVGTIDVYIPSSPGGNSDLSARIMLDYLAKNYPDANFNPINENTGNGTMAMELTRTGKNDGSCIFFTGSGSNIMYYQGKYQYSVMDPEQFTIISRCAGGAGQGSILLTQPDKPYNNLQEFMDYCKAHPGEVKVATNTGTTQEIKVKLLFMKYDVDVKYVILSGNDLVTALLAGNVDVGLQSDNKAEQYIAAGDLKGLVNNTHMEDGMGEHTKDIDTYYDLDMLDIAFRAPMYLVGPGNMDPALVERINEVFNGVVNDKDCMDRWAAMNSTYEPRTVEEIQAEVASMDADVEKVLGGEMVSNTDKFN